MSTWSFICYEHVVDMCCSCKKEKHTKVYKVHNSGGQLEETNILDNLPEHVDNPYLNRHVQHGVLGFRYENKNYSVTVYSSVEAKTFCYIMKLSPLRLPKLLVISIKILYSLCSFSLPFNLY